MIAKIVEIIFVIIMMCAPIIIIGKYIAVAIVKRRNKSTKIVVDEVKIEDLFCDIMSWWLALFVIFALLTGFVTEFQ